MSKNGYTEKWMVFFSLKLKKLAQRAAKHIALWILSHSPIILKTINNWEISSLQLKHQQEKLSQSGNNNVSEKDEKIIIEDLKTNLEFYQRENQLLKDETITKQRKIETILHQNNELLKLDKYYNKNIEQETIVRNSEEIVENLIKTSQESKIQIIGVVESTGKGTKRKNVDQIIPYNLKNNLEVNPRKVKNKKKIFIVSDSMIKNITDNGISRTNTIQMRLILVLQQLIYTTTLNLNYITNSMQ